MRCRFCGSKSLHEDKQHKTFSAGKAVVGAAAFGTVGAAAGFIGKDRAGYRCGACGAFMEAPMTVIMEDMINSSIEKAKSGESLSMYDYYKEQYPNIEEISFPALTEPSEVKLPSAALDRTFDSAIQIKHDDADESSHLKRQYFYGYWQPDCPVYIDTIFIRTNAQGDLLALNARNQDKRTIRSVYYQVTAYDDTGDEVSSVRCVYQNINTGCGFQLPSSIEFALNTSLAYRVDVACEKIAFENGDVWRAPENLLSFPVTDQILLTDDNFPRLKYARRKMWGDGRFERDTYMPTDHGDYWQCACRMPVKKGYACYFTPHGIKTYEELRKLLAQDNLRQDQQENVRKRASDRAVKTLALYEAATGKPKQANYDQALELMRQNTVSGIKEAISLFEKYPDFKDTAKQIDVCEAKLPELIEAEEKARIAAERKTEEERLESARVQAKRIQKKKAILAALAVVVGIVAALVAYNKVIKPNKIYNNAVALLQEGKYDEAASQFDLINGFRDSSEQALMIRNQIIFDEAMSLFDGGEYDSAIKLLKQLGDFNESKVKILEIESIRDQTIYDKAMEAYKTGEYELAEELFTLLGDFKDSKARLAKTKSTMEELKAAEEERIKEEELANIYSVAEKLVEKGELYQAAVTFYSLDGYKDSKARSFDLWGEITPRNTFAANASTLVAINNQGQIIATSYTTKLDDHYTDIIALAGGGNIVVGLRKNGTVQ